MVNLHLFKIIASKNLQLFKIIDRMESFSKANALADFIIFAIGIRWLRNNSYFCRVKTSGNGNNHIKI